MFYVNVAGTEKKIFFSYDREESVVKQKNGSEITQIHPINTICRITQDEKVLGKGIAECSPNDNFEYITGRKIALTRALKSAGFSTDQRRIVWDTFFNTK